MASQGIFDVAVLGGGAAGIVAGIGAARTGKSVVICERMSRLGKKILASGNGRCNLLNEDLSEKFYNPEARALVKNIFSRFGKDDILKFFKELGLATYSEAGRIFPITNQSASVLKVLEIELAGLSIPVELNYEIERVDASEDGFVLKPRSGRKISAKAVVIASGGRSYPALGSDGSAYRFAQTFGHTIIEPVPSAVPLTAKDPLCHVLQGQKIFAHVKALVDGRAVAESGGELLFTKYGLSGTAILDVSREISVAVNRFHKKNISVFVDMVPSIDCESLKTEMEKRIRKGSSSEELIAGILPNRFGLALENILKAKDPGFISDKIKSKEFRITGTRGWNEADFTAGGIDIKDVKQDTLESKLKRGLYFAGEVLDVDGCRGGYNLAWAWASGFIAGANA